MKPQIRFIAFILVVLLAACKGNDTTTVTPATKTELLIGNNWKMNRITDLSGTQISDSKLAIQTIAIYGMDIQFTNTNITRAYDRVSKQVLNSGTWKLIDNEQTVDINITGFVGQFGLSDLSKTKMSLKTKVPVSGVSQDAIMEFVPAN